MKPLRTILLNMTARVGLGRCHQGVIRAATCLGSGRKPWGHGICTARWEWRWCNSSKMGLFNKGSFGKCIVWCEVGLHYSLQLWWIWRASVNINLPQDSRNLFSHPYPFDPALPANSGFCHFSSKSLKHSLSYQQWILQDDEVPDKGPSCRVHSIPGCGLASQISCWRVTILSQ